MSPTRIAGGSCTIMSVMTLLLVTGCSSDVPLGMGGAGGAIENVAANRIRLAYGQWRVARVHRAQFGHQYQPHELFAKPAEPAQWLLRRRRLQQWRNICELSWGLPSAHLPPPYRRPEGRLAHRKPLLGMSTKRPTPIIEVVESC